MTLEIAIALLAFAAPVTAAIIKLTPERRNGNGYATKSDIDGLNKRFDDLKGRLEFLERLKWKEELRMRFVKVLLGGMVILLALAYAVSPSRNQD
jgi:hypothetical protein